MPLLTKRTRAIIFYFASAVNGLISLFFIFYTIRLLYITEGLTAIRTGGQGAYIGAVAFPLLALLFGFFTRSCLKATRKSQ